MEKFVWDERYSVGIASIDEEHKSFFFITNELVDLTVSANASRDAIRVCVKSLRDYANYHLTTEEAYFMKFHYPEAPQHVAEHDAYREHIKHFADVVEGKATEWGKLSEEIANFSITWLTNHILHTDKAYAIFFAEHGVR